MKMNLFHTVILAAVSVYFCYGQSTSPIPSGCPATSMTVQEFKDTFVGSFQIFFNISTASPNLLDCFYFVISDVTSDKGSSGTSNVTSFFQIGNQTQLVNATLYITGDSPPYEVNHPTIGQTAYFSASETNNILTVVECNAYGINYYIGCDVSNCSSKVQSVGGTVAQNVANSIGATLPLESYKVNFNSCTTIP